VAVQVEDAEAALGGGCRDQIVGGWQAATTAQLA
jgi:hypothetical protein